jgi:hypothetical protein
MSSRDCGNQTQEGAEQDGTEIQVEVKAKGVLEEVARVRMWVEVPMPVVRLSRVSS